MTPACVLLALDGPWDSSTYILWPAFCVPLPGRFIATMSSSLLFCSCIQEQRTEYKVKFVGKRIYYYCNTTATVHARLIVAGDIEENPGPDSTKYRRSSDYVEASIPTSRAKIHYTRDALLSYNHKQHLPRKVWATIKSLGLHTNKPTIRGTRGGVHKKKRKIETQNP